MKNTIKSILLIAGLAVATPAAYAQVSVGVGISADIAPPEIPVYEQPECPGDGYLWTPGYWAYDDGYYWVPGDWVMPPSAGVYWTPSYWGYDGGHYGFHTGYWGPHVGFYGGINYGFGYGGSGYYGGEWAGGRFRYNTAVTRVNVRVIHNTYVNNRFPRNSSRAGFNGRGGINARPSRGELAAARDRHIQPTRNQLDAQHNAGRDKRQFASANHGRPGVAAMNKTTRLNNDRVARTDAQKRTTATRANVTRNRTATNARRNAATAQTRAKTEQRTATRQAATRAKTEQRTTATRARTEQRAATRQATTRARTEQRAARPAQQRAPRASRPERAAQPQRAARPQQQREARPQQQRAARPQPQQRAPRQQNAERPDHKR